MKIAAPLIISLASFTVISAELPAGHPRIGQKPVADAASPSQTMQTGTIVDVINVPQYTYLQIKQAESTLWLAAPTTQAKKGDTVNFENGLVMNNFHSNALDRTFDKIFFVNHVDVKAAP